MSGAVADFEVEAVTGEAVGDLAVRVVGVELLVIVVDLLDPGTGESAGAGLDSFFAIADEGLESGLFVVATSSLS